MSIKWSISILMMFLGLTLISGICEMAYVTEQDTAVLYKLTHPSLSGGVGSGIWGIGPAIGAVTAGFTMAKSYLEALLAVVIFDYAMFQGSFFIVRLFFICIGAGFAIATAAALIRGTSAQ